MLNGGAILCDRDDAGVCRHCGHKARSLPHYRACPTFAPPPPAPPPLTPPTRGGPGTELKRLLSMVGIKAAPNCSCNARARIMDDQGVEWCEAHLEEIVGWLREEAERRGLPFIDAAGRLLVRRAIASARRKEAADAGRSQRQN